MVGRLRYKSPGEVITLEEWNDVVYALQDRESTSDGSYDGLSRTTNTDRGWQEPYDTYVWNQVGILPPYSIVQIEQDGNSLDFKEPVQQNVVAYKDSPTFITNEDISVGQGESFNGKVISHFPVRVLIDVGDPPEVGKECGPEVGGLVSASSDGLTCLSEPDEANEFVWVVATGGGSSSGTQMGVLGGDVAHGQTVVVVIVGDDLATIGVQAKVINRTNVTLLEGTYVYVYRHPKWPTSANSLEPTHSMFPSQLEDCGVQSTISP